MKDLYSRQEGIYIPSFFGMKIDCLSFDDNMSDRDLSLFVHEYVHFIQNITTLYGLERTNSDLSVLINMVNWIKSHKGSLIKVPLNNDILSKLTNNNLRIMNLTWGDSDYIRKIDIVSVINNPILSETIDRDRFVDSIIITYKNDGGEEAICSFGARDIYEGMAYLIEQHITSDYEHSPDIPYSTAYKVTKFIHPELVKDYRNILVVCDKALMSSNPGVEFIELVNWLKSINYVPNKPDDLFFFLDQNWETYDVKQRIDWLDNFTRCAEMARANMHSLLQDNFFMDYNRWVDVIIDFAIDLRSSKTIFLLDMVDMGNVRGNKYFQAFLRIAGSPLIETVKHEYFFVDPEGVDSSCLIYFKVFNQIYRLFTIGETQCNLMPWCNNSRNEVDVDLTCDKCPWEHPMKDGQFCTFKGIWQHWGLDGIKIISR